MRTDNIFDCSIQEVIDLMESIYDVDLSVFSESFLEKSIINRCIFVEVMRVSDYVIFLENNPTEAFALQQSLLITYTEFYRDACAFELFEEKILPELVRAKKTSAEIRIWSAGCSSGQEPYSIAMTTENYIALNAKPMRYRIIATDISDEELAFAKVGAFSEQSIQNIKLVQLNEFFEKSGNTYVISPRLKEKIIFSKYDILDKHSASPKESIFGEFDVVFCKNSLIYYNDECQKFIIDKLVNALSANGYLIIGESERHLLISKSELQEVAVIPMFYKKK
ncbi:MAG: CheR family methyltransferase [Clostridia bacterium]